MSKSSSILQKWIICGPEISRIVTEYIMLLLHHREGSSYPKKFHNKVLRFMQTMEEYGNHFSCYFEELYALGTGYFAEAVKSLYSKKTLGHDQYFKFYKNVFTNGSRNIHTPKIFKTCTKKISKTPQQIQHLKNGVSLFGRLYMTNQLREGDPDVLFLHENQLYLPALSNHNNKRLGKKSDLIGCIKPDVATESIVFNRKIFNEMALVYLLNLLPTNRLIGYIENIFIRYIKGELKCCSRIDIVWDQYFSHSMKESTRQKRGSVVRKKVYLTAKRIAN